MPAPVSKDSMTRCETPSMIYDTRRVPYVPAKGAIDPGALTKDTIETTQQRLNREMLERFQNTSSRMPHQSFVVVAQVGKYLFLAIMLPPYICFFGIPRWLFMNALPQLFIIIKTETLRVGRFFRELSKRIVDNMKGVMKQLIGDSLRMFNQQSKNFFRYLTHKIASFIDGIQALTSLLQQNVEKMRSLGTYAKEKITSKAVNLFKRIEHYKEKAILLIKVIANTLFYPLDLADQYILKPLTKWCKKRINIVVNSVYRTYSKTQKIIRKVAQPIVSFIDKVAKSVYHPICQGLQYSVQQISAWLQPPLELVRRGIERYKERLSRGIAKSASFVRVKAEEVASMIISNVQIPMQLVVQYIGWAWWQTSSFFKSPWKYLKKGGASGKRTFTSIGHSILNGAKSISRHTKWIAKGVLEGMNGIFDWIKLTLYWLVRQLLTLPRKILKGITWAFKAGLRAVGYCIYGVRIVIAWGWVISSSGMILVRELTRDIARLLRGEF